MSALTCGVLRRFELETEAAELARTAALRGRTPIAYERYVRDMAHARASQTTSLAC